MDNETTDQKFEVVIPEERIKTQQELRQEVTSLEGKFQELNSIYSSILTTIQNTLSRYNSDISQIRTYERELLESQFSEHEKDICAFLLEGGVEAVEENKELSPEEKELCKQLYRRIARLTHPDFHDKDKMLEQMFTDASTAYKNGDLFSLKLIMAELDAKDDTRSKLMTNDTDMLEKKKLDLELLITELTQHINGFEFAGLKIKDYLANSKINAIRFYSDVERQIRIKLGTIEQLIGKLKKEEPKQVSESKNPESKELLMHEIVDSIAVVPDEKKESMLKSQLKILLDKIDKISPYYSGLVGHDFIIRIFEDESNFSRKIMIEHDCTAEVDLARYGFSKESYDGKVIRLQVSRDLCLFILNKNRSITLPEERSDLYDTFISVVAEANEIMGKPVRVLEISHDTYYKPILGRYEEHNCEWISDKYKLTNTSEIIFNRLIRAMLLLKIPRFEGKHFEAFQYVYVDDDDEKEYKYDGSSGIKNIGDIVEMVVKCPVKGSKTKFEKKKIKGEIIVLEDEVSEDRRFNKLLGSANICFSGYMEINSNKIPFSMTYKGYDCMGNLMSTINNAYGDMEILLDINKKKISLRYERAGNKKILSVSGIKEELLPDLLFKIVESLQITKIKGEGRFSEIDYL